MTSAVVRPLPQGHLRAVELVGASLLVVQQPVVPQVDRVHAGRRRHEAVEVVRRLPRSRRVLQRPLRSADQGADRHARSAGRSGVHVVPLDRARRQLDGAGRLHDRVPAASRSGRERATRSCRGRTTRCIYLAPEPHRDTFLKPFHREQTAEFCSTCHKVHLDVPVNSYRWFRGFNDYDNWQASGVSGQGARSFYYPAKPQKCADCHMPLGRVERSGGEGRQGALAPVSRREHRAAVRQPRSGAAEGGPGFPARRPDLGRRLRHHARRRVAAPTETGGVDARRSRDLSSTFAVGEESASFGAAGGRYAEPPPKCSRRSTRFQRPSVAANRSGSRSSCARARSGTSSRAAPSTRSTSGSSSRPSTTRAACCCTAARSRTAARAGRAGRALLSQPAARRARQPDQQAQRVVDAIGRLRAADSAGRGRHDALPAADSRPTPATGSSCGRR